VVEVEEEVVVVVVVVVVVAAAAVVEVAAAVPRTETRFQELVDHRPELVDRRPELVRLELVVHKARWRQQVQSPRTKPETRKN
jgi:hypothetical protein